MNKGSEKWGVTRSSRHNTLGYLSSVYNVPPQTKSREKVEPT